MNILSWGVTDIAQLIAQFADKRRHADGRNHIAQFGLPLFFIYYLIILLCNLLILVILE